MVMRNSDIQDEIMNKIQRKIDKDIERMKQANAKNIIIFFKYFFIS